MKIVAKQENLSPEEIRELVASRKVVIPKNVNHEFSARGIGKGLTTKVNANIGTSPSHFDLGEELEKLDTAVKAGDVREGVIATRIAAHIGDIEKGVKGAWERNMMMSAARKRFDWNTMFEMAIDPVKARHYRTHSEDKDRDVCTMCGDLCAMKTFERIKP